MSTTLYKEAIAEAQQLKMLAEKNAKNKIIEYNWFIEKITNNVVSDRTQITNTNVKKNKAKTKASH